MYSAVSTTRATQLSVAAQYPATDSDKLKLAARYGLRLTYGPTKLLQNVKVTQHVTVRQQRAATVVAVTCS